MGGIGDTRVLRSLSLDVDVVARSRCYRSNPKIRNKRRKSRGDPKEAPNFPTISGTCHFRQLRERRQVWHPSVPHLCMLDPGYLGLLPYLERMNEILSTFYTLSCDLCRWLGLCFPLAQWLALAFRPACSPGAEDPINDILDTFVVSH